MHSDPENEIQMSRRVALSALFGAGASLGVATWVTFGQDDGEMWDVHQAADDEEFVVQVAQELEITQKEAEDLINAQATAQESSMRSLATVFAAVNAFVAEIYCRGYERVRDNHQNGPRP